MREFIVLLGEILLIALLQTIVEGFLEDKKLQLRIVNTTCVVGSLFLLLQFVYEHILSEISAFAKLPF